MSSSNLVRLGYKKEVSYGVTPAAVAATAVLDLTADITLTSVKKGAGRNTKTFTLQVAPAAANPTNTILAAFTGTESAIVCTITPNDGTNNGSVAVNLTTAQLRELISTGAVVGKTVTITDASSLRVLQTATGGGATNLADGGEGDGVVATFSGGSGDFQTARFTSEKYSGTPQTAESQQIRTDRMSSGQVVTGLQVDGGHAIELAKEQAIEDFMESAMFNAWVQSAIVNDTFAFNATTKVLSRASGSFVTEGVKLGDFIKLTNVSVAASNNKIVMVTDVQALQLTLAIPTGMADFAAEAASYQICDKLTIGTTKKSLTIEKTFTDLTTKALIYRGCMVSQMQLQVEYGALVTGSFDTQGNDYANADAASEFASYNEYFEDPATSDTLNGSVDMPFLATDVTGSWDQDAFCLQSLSLNLNNNFTVQNCIGRIAPENYNPGTAQIGVELSSYLKDANWDLINKKLSQAAFGIGFMVQNSDGWYGFFLPAIQVSFDDPQSGGANQDISLDMKGSAKVADDGASALAIFREPT